MNLVQLLSEELERSSLRDLEAKTGISHTALLRIVRGQLKSLPEIETLDKIAKAFSLPLWRIIEMAGADLGLEEDVYGLSRRLVSLAGKQEDYNQVLVDLLHADRIDLRAILNYFAVTKREGVPDARVSIFDRKALETRKNLFALAPQLAPDLPVKRNVYEGRRVPVPGSATTDVLVTVNGQALRELLQTPDVDYEWGFTGQGSSRLATAILTYEYGPQISTVYDSAFQIDIVSSLPRSNSVLDWAIDSEEILLWMLLRRLLEQASV
jgi:transcriptional regulator with XRE-family HTH domain